MYVCVAEGLAIAGGIGLLTFAVLSTAAAALMAVVVVSGTNNFCAFVASSK
jgi:hypothetical protein